MSASVMQQFVPHQAMVSPLLAIHPADFPLPPSAQRSSTINVQVVLNSRPEEFPALQNVLGRSILNMHHVGRH